MNKKLLNLSIFLVLSIVLITLVSCSPSTALSGTYSSTNESLGRTISISFSEDGTLIWEETYNILGDTVMTFYGTYTYDSETAIYTLDVKAGGNVFATDTVFTATKISSTEIVINGGVVDNETFIKSHNNTMLT